MLYHASPDMSRKILYIVAKKGLDTRCCYRKLTVSRITSSVGSTIFLGEMLFSMVSLSVSTLTLVILSKGCLTVVNIMLP